MAHTSLEVTSLSKRFGTTEVLHNVSLSVTRGEFLTVLGPSGCGKSTLLRVIAGLETETTGRVFIDAEDMACVSSADRNIAMVFQSYALYPHLTVAENIGLPLRVRRLSRLSRSSSLFRMGRKTRGVIAGINEEVRHIAGQLGIEPFLLRLPHALSGGQRQRVALARAMIRNPRIFLMDEPLSNLDAQLRVQMRSEIVALHRRLGATFIYVTHDQVEAMTMSDRIAVMMNGRIAQLGAPLDIYRYPETVEVACFVGAPRINLLQGRSDRQGRVFAGPHATGLITDINDADVQIAIRPEALNIAAPGGGFAFPADVTRCENLGPEILVHLHANPFGPLVLRLSDGQAPPACGATVVVGADPQSLLLFGGDGRRLPDAQSCRLELVSA